MASNKMLIDASHPEETRVAVVRGNRIEEFDFESLAKKQLRGNIYLAKVTRVEPSLQAAFIDYGGNRHGFLAFSEIHPDYYQIPLADRQALLEEEAAQAEENGEAEDEDLTRRRRRRAKRAKAVSDDDDNDSASDHSDEAERESASDDDGSSDTPGIEEAADLEAVASDDSVSDTPTDEGADAQEEPPEEPAIDTAGDADAGVDPAADADDENDPRSIAAIVETDSISEPAPDEDEPEEEAKDIPETGAAAEEGDDTQAADESETKKPPRKRARSRRKKTKENKETAEIEDAAVKVDSSDAAEAADAAKPDGDKPAKKKRTRAKKTSDDDAADQEVEAPTTEEDAEDAVESVGVEDALEEVPFRRKPRRQYKIQEVIKRRQIMLVQVVKEERGNKGAALTTYLSLAGRYSVLMPNTARGGGISRKITNANDRKRLKSIASDLDVQPGMGVILRTAGATRTKAEIKRDFEYLMRMWENVRSLTLSSTAPCLVYEEGSLIKRSIRDLYNKDIGEVLVAGEAGYKEAKDFMRMLMPSHAKNVKAYGEEQAIFTNYGVEQQLDRLLSAQVTLKSGGYLVINQTEALVSIDVNSGRSTREHSIEDTALQTNLEAADEISRQLRLRDLAGLIVIDFIDMEEKRNNRAVEKRLKEALKDDRARIQVGRISHFGLLEMSRQRIRASVMESTMDVCPHCEGSGYVRSESSIALHVFRSIEDHVSRHFKHDVIVRCPTPIAIDILNSKRTGLFELEGRYGVQITVVADATLPGQSFIVERGEPAQGGTARTAQHVQAGDPEDAIPAVEDDSVEASQSEAQGRGRRRKRKGRRSDTPKSEESQAEQTADATETIENEAATDGESDEEGRPKRKRRRGKRGGRRNRGERGDEQSDIEAGEDETTSPVTVEETAEQDRVHSDAQDDVESISAPDSNVVELEPAESVQQAESEEDDQGRRSRATKRPRAKAKPSAEEPEGGEIAAAAVSDGPEIDSEDQENKDQPKRRGWWSKGGGFF